MLPVTRFVALVTVCLTAFMPAAAQAQDDETDGSVRCISINRISSTQVLDDHNILFHMRGGTIYRNELPHRCPGLRLEKAFMYRTSVSQLCDIDIITVLTDHGFGFTPGPSCGLGRFQPTTKEDIKALKNAARRPEPEDPPTADPEEID